MKMKNILWVLLMILIFIQFIQTFGNNNSEALGANDITHVDSVPPSVMKILDKACFDCHSNHTRSMWYMHIQPIGFWINHHINDGKRHLNFSEFASYKVKRQIHKYEEIAEEVKEHEMPLDSYLWMHPEARLTEAEINELADWAMANFHKRGGKDAD